MSESRKKLRNTIEALTSVQQEEIFKIFKKYDCEYTENVNGVFINLTNIPYKVIRKINNTLKYFKDSEKNLTKDDKNREKMFNYIKEKEILEDDNIA